MSAATKQFTIFTKFAVKNNLSGPMLAIAKGADKAAAKLSQIKAGAQKFGEGAKKAGKFALGVGVAAAAAGAAVFELANGAQKAADEIQNTSDALGISAKTLQEYRYAGIAAGLTTQDIDDALGKLTKNLGKDSVDVDNALYQIGLSVSDLKAAGPDKALETVADGMAKLTDPTKAAAVATALFGKSSIRMTNLMRGGSKAVEAQRKEAQETGYVFSDVALNDAGALNDSMDKLGATAIGLRNRLGARLAPSIKKVVESLSAGIAPGGKFSKIIDNLGNFAGNIGSGIGPVFDQVVAFLPKIIDFAKGIWSAIQPIVKPIMEMVAPILGIFEKLMPVITAVVGAVATILGPIADTIKFILEGIDSILGKSIATNGQQGQAQVFAKGGSGGGMNNAATRSMIPMSPATGTAGASGSSTVDINVNAAPGASAAVKQTGRAPGVTLNTGPQKPRAMGRGR
jgi:hypothetical protein